jgi:hypothetical protein
MIPRVNVSPAELYMLVALSDFDIFEQSEDAGHSYREADAPYFLIVFGQNLDLTLKQQTQRTLPGDDIYRFIGCI